VNPEAISFFKKKTSGSTLGFAFTVNRMGQITNASVLTKLLLFYKHGVE